MKSFTNADILAQLKKILASKQLAASTVLADFLTFIVNETLNGNPSVLKEYTIGVEALKKESDFNPQIDGIVRIHAGRLRRALKEYYYEEGANDRLVISIPIGGYVPNFEMREKISANNSPMAIEEPLTGEILKTTIDLKRIAFPVDRPGLQGLNYRPSISVLPFKKIGEGKILENIANGIGESLSTELTQFESLKVVSYYSSDHIISLPSDIRTLGALLGAEYILTGSVQLYNHLLQINVQLNSPENGDQLWARRFEKNDPGKDYRAFQEKVIDTVLASVAGLHGAISLYELKKFRPPDHPGISWWYTEYTRNFDYLTTQKAKTFYKRIIDHDPSNAYAMAFFSEILAGESLLLHDGSEQAEQGIHYANLAIQVDPHCQQAYQALAINRLMQGDREYIRVLERGLEINPKSTEYRGAMGALLIYGGEFDRGIKIIDVVMELNPFLPWWQVLSCSIYSYHKKSYADALYWADRVEMNVISIPIIKAATYAQQGSIQKAETLLNRIKLQYPDTNLHDAEFLKRIFYSDALIDEIRDGLEKAGID